MSDRGIRAFELSALPTTALFLLLMITNSRNLSEFTAGLVATFILYFVFFFLNLLFGVPIHLFLKPRHRTGLAYYLGLALLPVALIGGLLTVWAWRIPLSPVNPFGLGRMWQMHGTNVMMICATHAALSATMFWYAGVRQRTAHT